MTPPRQRHVAPIDVELRAPCEWVASKPEIVAIAALLAAEDVRADPKATSEINWKFGNWLRKATRIELTAAEFHSSPTRSCAHSSTTCSASSPSPASGASRTSASGASTRSSPAPGTTRSGCTWRRRRTSTRCAIRAPSPRIVSAAAASTAISRLGRRSGSKQRARRREDSEVSAGLDVLEGLLENLLDAVPPQDVMRLIRSQGRDGAVTALADRLGKAGERRRRATPHP